MAKRSVKTNKLSALRIPGFTAEAALYDKIPSYRMLQTHINSPSAVELAFYKCWGNVCCDEWGDCIYKGPRFM
jgi:hypothetical protein